MESFVFAFRHGRSTTESDKTWTFEGLLKNRLWAQNIEIFALVILRADTAEVGMYLDLSSLLAGVVLVV